MSNQVIQQRNPDDAGGPTVNTAKFPNQNVLVNQQVNTLIQICQNSAAVISTMKHVEHEQTEGGKNDGGAICAAETTIIKALGRMDAILDDSARWGLGTYDRLEKALVATYAKQTEAFEASIRESNTRMRPHMLYPPRFIPLPRGQWAAFLGDVNDWENSVAGVGMTLPEALVAFDEAFMTKKAKVKTHEQTKVDGGTGDRVETVEVEGVQRPGNRGEAGQVGKIGQRKTVVTPKAGKGNRRPRR